MKMLRYVVAILGALSFAGCGGGDDVDPLLGYVSAVDQLRAGQGVPGAALYEGGTVPHKLGETYMKVPKSASDFSYVLYNSYSYPPEWCAKSVSDIQLYVKEDTTTTHTGQTQLYVRFQFNTQGTTVEYVHLTRTYTLIVARTGEVLATIVLQGVWSGFPATVHEGDTIVTDDIPAFSVVDWVRPFVE